MLGPEVRPNRLDAGSLRLSATWDLLNISCFGAHPCVCTQAYMCVEANVYLIFGGRSLTEPGT